MIRVYILNYLIEHIILPRFAGTLRICSVVSDIGHVPDGVSLLLQQLLFVAFVADPTFLNSSVKSKKRWLN